MFKQATVILLAEKLSTVPKLAIEKTLTHDVDELVASVLPPMRLVVIDDKNTRETFGDRVHKALHGRFPCTHVTLDNPGADEITADYLRTQTLSADALISVGSGTINDLCKYVSHIDRKPYISFPTAASMNGYLSANASITMQQHKKTLPAHMPVAVFCDLGIIAKAPNRLSKAGLGDCLARPTAQADWLLSHLLFDTDYDEAPFALIAPYEPELFEHARGIALGDMKSIEQLITILLLSGLGMTIAGGSYPASQGEHMIAHAYEMLHNTKRRPNAAPENVPNLHGEEIGVTTLAMARLQEKYLHTIPELRADDFDSKTMIHNYGSKIAAQARKSFDGKQELIHHTNLRYNEAIANWNNIAGKISQITLPVAKIESVLKAAEAPHTLNQLKWSTTKYDLAMNTARYLRERFTFLDLE